MKYVKYPKFPFAAFFALLISILLFAGCTLGVDSGNRVTLRDEELTLVDLNDSVLTSRALSPTGTNRAVKAVKPAPGGATITLVAEISPPHDSLGRELQASHIALTANGKYAIVSYMLKGEEHSGAVDIFDVSNASRPVLLKNTLFENFDIAAVIEDSGKLYLAGQKLNETESGKNAYVVAINYSASNGSLDETSAASIALPGHFATDLVIHRGLLYVTTGAYSAAQPGVGLFALRRDGGEFTIANSAVTGYPDLRSVAVGGADLAVFEAQHESPASISHLDIYNGDSFADLSYSVNLTAFPAQAEAKSKIGYFGGLFFVAANLSGVAIVDPDDGTVRASIPAPSLADLAPELQSSNAVSWSKASSKDIILIANGEAGLWVGDGDLVKAQTTASLDSINGSIRFGEGESANYVAGKSGLVVAAVGTGGLKVLNMAIR